MQWLIFSSSMTTDEKGELWATTTITWEMLAVQMRMKLTMEHIVSCCYEALCACYRRPVNFFSLETVQE